jgi:hypothetical protein
MGLKFCFNYFFFFFVKCLRVKIKFGLSSQLYNGIICEIKIRYKPLKKNTFFSGNCWRVPRTTTFIVYSQLLWENQRQNRRERKGVPRIESETSSQPKKKTPHFFSAVSYSSRHLYAARGCCCRAASIKPSSLASKKATLSPSLTGFSSSPSKLTQVSSLFPWGFASEPEVRTHCRYIFRLLFVLSYFRWLLKLFYWFLAFSLSLFLGLLSEFYFGMSIPGK